MLKRIGVFNTPTGIKNFGSYSVFDLRSGTETSPAEWSVLENRAIVCLVLQATNEPSIGSYVAGAGGLKWDLSINIREDVRMLAMWAGTDVSRTGRHGTQMYAYLATDLHGCKATQMAACVRTGMVGAEWIAPAKKERAIRIPEGYGVTLNLYGVGLFYHAPYSVKSGATSPDHMRELSQTVPGRASVVVDGKSHEIGEEFRIDVAIAKIREILPIRSFELDQVLLSEEFYWYGSIETIRALMQLYQVHGKVSDSGLCADYPARKAEEEAFLKAGGMFDLSGRFRRMGASGNGDFWVIRPDGTLREPDELVRRKDYPEGQKRWLRVEAEEIAISWSVWLLRDVYENSLCEILHESVGKRTILQTETLRRVEKEIGVKAKSFDFAENPSILKSYLSTKPVVREVAVVDNTPAKPATADLLSALAKKFAK